MRIFGKKSDVADRVWVNLRGFVCCQFASSGRNGRFSTFDPNVDLSLTTEDGDTHASLVLERTGSAGGTRLTLEEFANRGNADQARDLVVKSIQASYIRSRRMKRFLWVALPVMGFVVVLSMIGSGVNPQTQAGAPSLSEFYRPGTYSDKDMNTLYAASSFKKGMDGMPADLPSLPSGKPNVMQLDVAKVDRLNSIRFGSGSPVIYVFSDPLCPACQQLEPILEGTKQPYAVIPVALKGEESAVKIARIMCAKDPGKAWRDDVSGSVVPLDVTDKVKLGVCAKKIIDNMNAFKEYGLTTVPALVNAQSGKVILPNGDADVMSAIKK